MNNIIIVIQYPNRRICFDNIGLPKNYLFETIYMTTSRTYFKFSIFPNGRLALKFPKIKSVPYKDYDLWYAPKEKEIFELGDTDIIKIYQQIDAENKKQNEKDKIKRDKINKKRMVVSNL
jgi:hypothetical protein